MANPYEILVTEISPTEVNYDLSSTPPSFREQFEPDSMALRALEILGCVVKGNGADLLVVLPDDVEAACEQVPKPKLEHGGRISDTDFLVLGGMRRFSESGRPSELSTKIIEGVVGLANAPVAVRRHATYRSMSAA